MAAISSAASGPWSEPATWVGGVLPAAADTVTIVSPHVVTMDLNETDGTKCYGRVTINAGATLIHADGTTSFCVAAWLYVSGRYEMKPGSTLKFKATSKSSGTEGAAAGLIATGGSNGCQVVMNGSVPLPETYLTSAPPLDTHVLAVADASGFSPGEYIAVYRDISGDATWGWDSTNQSDEGFIIQYISGNNIYIRQRVPIYDTLKQNVSIGNNYAYVNNIRRWQNGMKLWIDNELLTISTVDEATEKLTFTSNATAAHTAGAMMYQTGTQKAHSINDKVYKIATVATADSAVSATTITVANAAMLEIGDRLVIEGPTRGWDKAQERKIIGVNGNVLTLDLALTQQVKIGFIVTKTNRDCVITSTDEAADANRWFMYYQSGASSITGRKCVMRYVECSHYGNSYTDTYRGVCIRSDFNRSDCEREIRGCVFRDNWSTDRSGLWLYSAHYIVARNNVVYKSQNGINTYDQNGASCYNNISIGGYSSTYRNESSYYYNQWQYNIGLNTDYPVLYYSDYNAIYPEWHNIFKHSNRALYFSNGAVGSQYGTWMKNYYEDYYYKQHYVEGTRIMVQDIMLIPASDATFSANSSSYANYDERGMNGGMLVIVNEDFKRGRFEMHGYGGYIERDETLHMGNGWSYKYYVNNSSWDFRVSQMIYVKYGVPVRVVAWMRKSSSYNGSLRPRIVAKGIYLNGGTALYQEMPNVNDQWVKVILEFTPTRSEMIQIGVGGRGTAGNFWVDPRVKVTTFDLDLVQGPYSVNLMFNLDEAYTTPGILLGGATLG